MNSKYFLLLSLLCLSILAPTSLFGQFQDSFDDGDFTQNPIWEGDTGDFVVNNDLELQLNASAPGTSVLYVNTSFPDSTLWELYFLADLAPSGSNGLRVYLQSDNIDFTSANGYYFEFGETGSDDALNFYRMDAGSPTLLGTGTTAAVGSAPADGRMKITRSVAGEWEVKVDYAGGNNVVTDLTFNDNTHPGSTGSYFGVQCEYTSSNTANFFFDDFNVAPNLPDVTPPTMTSIEIVSGFELDVYFSEALDENSAENSGNYVSSNGLGNPASAMLDGGNPSLVHLTFANEFPSGQENILSVNGVADIVGNTAVDLELPFIYFFVEIPQQYEIVFNELMPDPNPVVGLPEVEFVELYNNSDKTFQLEGSTIESGSTPQVFGNYIFEPNTYLILCDDSNVDSLTPYGDVMAFSTFPALSNNGDEFIIKNEDGAIIDAVAYNISWYQDGNKSDGGWSLELINPNSPCEFESNWRAAEDISGGTPGRANSVLDQEQELTEGKLESIFLNTTELLFLTFNVGVNQTLALDPLNYNITPSLGNITIFAVGDLGNQVVMEFSQPLETGVTYQISTSNLVDCIGNAVDGNSLNFGKPEIAEAGDILINEVLFNPETGGSDFVELYNHSNKIIDLSSLSIGNFMEGDSSANGITASYLLLPQSYVALTESPSSTLENYTVLEPDALKFSLLPSFADRSGNVTLYRSDPNGSTIIDQFDYDKDFHSPFLDDENGVSLERIDFDQPTQSQENWYSAAASAGYATPTSINSQFISFGNAEDLLTLPKKVFSPDADNFEDLLFLQFNTETPGYSADIKIYDAEGRLVKHLLKNELIPVQGLLSWDGITDELDKAAIGIYILVAEFVSGDGDLQQAKETFVLATKL